MEQLAELKNLALQLSSAADLLKDYIQDVVLVEETDDNGQILFPKKLKVIEVMAMAIREMRAIENFVYALEHSTPTQSDESWLTFSKREAEPWLSFLQNHHYELGEIMDAMATDGEDIAEEDYIWMRQRLVLTRRTIDEILEAAKDQLHLPKNHFFNTPENQ